MLDDDQRHLASTLQRQFNAAGSKKMPTIDKTVFLSESKGGGSGSVVQMLCDDFMQIMRDTQKRMLPTDPVLLQREEQSPAVDCPQIPRLGLVDFLRAPVLPGERECSFGRNCESYRLFDYYRKQHPYINDDVSTMAPHFGPRQEPFALREFFLPAHQASIAERLRVRPSGTTIEDVMGGELPQPCLLCTRLVTSTLATQLAMKFDDVDQARVVQNHANIFGVEGEYKDQAKLVRGKAFTGLIAGIVEYDRNHYVPHYIRLEGVRDPIPGWAEVDDIIVKSSPAAAANR